MASRITEQIRSHPKAGPPPSATSPSQRINGQIVTRTLAICPFPCMTPPSQPLPVSIRICVRLCPFPPSCPTIMSRTVHAVTVGTSRLWPWFAREARPVGLQRTVPEQKLPTYPTSLGQARQGRNPSLTDPPLWLWLWRCPSC